MRTAATSRCLSRPDCLLRRGRGTREVYGCRASALCRGILGSRVRGIIATEEEPMAGGSLAEESSTYEAQCGAVGGGARRRIRSHSSHRGRRVLRDEREGPDRGLQALRDRPVLRQAGHPARPSSLDFPTRGPGVGDLAAECPRSRNPSSTEGPSSLLPSTSAAHGGSRWIMRIRGYPTRSSVAR